MIPTTEILECRRKRLKYQKQLLARHLDISMQGLNNMLIAGIIPDRHLTKWCEFLELGNIPAIKMYNDRYKIYRTIEAREDIKKLIADLLYFDIPRTKIATLHSLILADYLPKVLEPDFHFKECLHECTHKDE